MPKLIDKQASMRAICDGCFKSRAVDIELRCRGTCNVIDILQQQPTIEPEVRHGRWIYVGEETMHDGWTYRKHKCSECGFPTVEAINFCPNCGSMNSDV